MSSILKSSKVEFSQWFEKIRDKRCSVGKSVIDFKYAKCRVRQLKGPNAFPPLDEQFETNAHNATQKAAEPYGILYWMIRDQRIQGNISKLFLNFLTLFNVLTILDEDYFW